MELQTCAFIQTPNTHYCNYETFSIHFVIMCLLIIYITALSLVLILKQPIEIIKEVMEEVVKEEVVKEVVKEEEKNEEELQSKYIKQIQVLFEKKIKNSSLGGSSASTFWDRLKKENLNKEASAHHWLQGYAYEDLRSLTYSVKPITDILESLYKINRETINKELDEEIIFNAKKAGLFVFHSDYDEIEFYKDTYELFKIVKMVDFSNMSLEKEQARQNKFSQCIEEYRDKMRWKASPYDEEEEQEVD